jgi:hypothetical protein
VGGAGSAPARKLSAEELEHQRRTSDVTGTKLELAAPTLMAGDFVPDVALGTVAKLLEDKSRRYAEKKAEWLREQAVSTSSSTAAAARSSPVSSILVLAAAAPLT